MDKCIENRREYIKSGLEKIKVSTLVYYCFISFYDYNSKAEVVDLSEECGLKQLDTLMKLRSDGTIDGYCLSEEIKKATGYDINGEVLEMNLLTCGELLKYKSSQTELNPIEKYIVDTYNFETIMLSEDYNNHKIKNLNDKIKEDNLSSNKKSNIIFIISEAISLLLFLLDKIV